MSTHQPRRCRLWHRRAWILLVALVAGCKATGPTQPGPARATAEAEYWSGYQAHETKLVHHGPPPHEAAPIDVPPTMQRVEYAPGRGLWGLLAVPESAEPAPAVVYLHGNFSLGQKDVDVLETIRARGFVAFAPVLRGENGAPGTFTLLHDELRDAIDAVRYVGSLEQVNSDRVFVFGHSVGGALAALVSLVPDLDVVATGSSGGIYVPETFVRWSTMKRQRHLIRFDPLDREELELRTLLPNVASMQRLHLAYVGTDDRWFHDNVARTQAAADEHDAPFEHHLVPGDHMTALPLSLEAFLDEATSNTAQPPEP